MKVCNVNYTKWEILLVGCPTRVSVVSVKDRAAGPDVSNLTVNQSITCYSYTVEGDQHQAEFLFTRNRGKIPSEVSFRIDIIDMCYTIRI